MIRIDLKLNSAAFACANGWIHALRFVTLSQRFSVVFSLMICRSFLDQVRASAIELNLVVVMDFKRRISIDNEAMQ